MRSNFWYEVLMAHLSPSVIKMQKFSDQILEHQLPNYARFHSNSTTENNFNEFKFTFYWNLRLFNFRINGFSRQSFHISFRLTCTRTHKGPTIRLPEDEPYFMEDSKFLTREKVNPQVPSYIKQISCLPNDVRHLATRDGTRLGAILMSRYFTSKDRWIDDPPSN